MRRKRWRLGGAKAGYVLPKVCRISGGFRGQLANRYGELGGLHGGFSTHHIECRMNLSMEVVRSCSFQ